MPVGEGEPPMLMKLSKSILLALATLSLALFTSGCNTMKGVGKDVEKTGDKIQDAAR
jgi:predicted small secreted protein